MDFKYYEVASHAEVYNKFRPSPPQELAKRIVNYLTEKISPPLEDAIDVGCGGGQSTEILAPFFLKVRGFDPCESQVIEATRKNKFNNITYRVGNAEHIDCPDASVQLITACQACHWFDLPKFYAEVERLLVPGGVLAMYGYLLPQPQCGDKQLSHIVKKFYCDTLGDYVLPQSKMVYLDNYRSEQFNNIPFIKEPLVRDEFTFKLPSGTVPDLVGYASSWSGFQNLHKHVGEEKSSQVLNSFQAEDNVLQLYDFLGSRAIVLTTPENVAHSWQRNVEPKKSSSWKMLSLR